jgi:hypothetical protein
MTVMIEFRDKYLTPMEENNLHFDIIISLNYLFIYFCYFGSTALFFALNAFI